MLTLLQIDTIEERAQASSDIGAGEVILWLCTPDLEQLDQLAAIDRSFSLNQAQ